MATFKIGQTVTLSAAHLAGLERVGVDLTSAEVGGAGPVGTVGTVTAITETDLGEGETLIRYSVQWPGGECSYSDEHLVACNSPDPIIPANETNKIPASQYGDRDYGTAARATKACLDDWLTSGGLNDVPPTPAAQLARELFASSEGRQWISLDRDEDGLPVDGELRCDEEEAAEVIAEIQAETSSTEQIQAHDDDDAALDETECVYCGRYVENPREDAPAPRIADDAEWTRLGKQHAPDCEWIVTRAHRL